MPLPKFLEQIADYYTDPARIGTLSDITFIFPNKRSALFLKHYIQQRITAEYALMPRFTTFQHFASYTSQLPEASRFELLFMLYSAYVDVLKEINPKAAESAQFDKFIFWGDMILEDFDVIDSSLADAAKLYANLKGVREITADYLTDEQKEVIERIWGQTNLTQHIEGFWLHIGNDRKTEITSRFIQLWEVLAEVYTRMHKSLTDARKATKGMQLRRSVKVVKDTPIEQLAKRRYVFVGLADLSNAEIAIMERMRRAGCAEFFWDLAAPFFHDGVMPDKSNEAVRFIARMAERFPMPEDFALEPIETTGRIDIIGVPSSVIQTKIAGQIIEQMKPDEQTAFNTAIVVPDPGQLMALMLSLPKQEHGINITLGLPYTSTTFATLFSAIISMQRRSRKPRDRERTFFYQDILEVLLHPHLQIIAPAEANELRGLIYEKNMYNISSEMLLEKYPSLAFIFRPINEKSGDAYLDDIDSSCRYIEQLLSGLKERLLKHGKFENSFEAEIIDFFESQVKDLKDLISHYGIRMEETTFLSLFERIMLAKSISMEGTPLKGLQVMGVLETRCLDFDNMIFLAMNERSLPRREYVRTMIPNSLRRGYGLPTIEHTESFYSYYFFRAIGRAKNTTLLYDTRPPGAGRGEISRYLEQLIYVYRNENVTHKIIDLSGTLPSKRQIEVQKTEDVMKKLALFKKTGSGKKISASALKTYLTCPLRFYLEYVNGIREDNEPTDYIDSATLGDIFHLSAKRIYDTLRGRPITAEIIDRLLAGKDIDNAIIAEIAAATGRDPETTVYSDLNSEGYLILSQIRPQIQLMLKEEKETLCSSGRSFEYVAGELDVIEPQWKVGDHRFNFRMQIDRIDRRNPSTLTFIDYKTGLDEIEVKNDITEIFNPDNNKKHAIFQLLTYAAAYMDLAEELKRTGHTAPWLAEAGQPDDIDIRLYTLRNLMRNGTLDPITYKKQPMPPYSEIKEEFYPLLEQLIDNIFNDTTPFLQADNEDRCKHCHFLSVCGRNPVDKNF